MSIFLFFRAAIDAFYRQTRAVHSNTASKASLCSKNYENFEIVCTWNVSLYLKYFCHQNPIKERLNEYDENAVLVSGGGTNLQAIMDAMDRGEITNAEIAVVISNNANAYALERARMKGIEAICVSPKAYASRAEFNQALLETIQSYHVDWRCSAGCLVVIPEIMVKAYPNKIINIHPALFLFFAATGYYGLKVHEGVLEEV